MMIIASSTPLVGMRRCILASALAGMLGAGLGVSPACAQHTEHSEDDNRMGVPEPVDGTAESAEHHAPAISWFSTGEDGEAPFAGRVLSFLLWAGILVYFGRKPLAVFLSTRRRAILDGLEEAKRLEAAAHAKHQEYTARIENLDTEIAQLKAEFERAGMAERDRMVAEASSRANKLHEEARFLVEQQIKQLKEELTREAIEAAVSAADKILRERATGADQQRLADEYLARLRSSVEKGAIGPKSAAKGAS